MADVLPAQPRFRRSSRPHGTPLQGVADIAFQGAAVAAGRGEIGQRARPSDQPERGRVNTRPDAGITSFHPDQSGDRDTEALRPCTLRFAPPYSGDGEVLTQPSQCLNGGRGQGEQGWMALWHNKEFINLIDLVKFI